MFTTERLNSPSMFIDNVNLVGSGYIRKKESFIVRQTKGLIQFQSHQSALTIASKSVSTYSL